MKTQAKQLRMFANEKNTNVYAANVLITTIKRILNKIGLHRR